MSISHRPWAGRQQGLARALTRYIAGRSTLTAGAAISATVIPLIAATTLDATSTQMGLVIGIGLVVSLVLQIPLAVWSDPRDDQVVVLAWASTGSAVVTLAIPVLWLLDLLSMATLYLCVLGSAVAVAVRASLGHAIINDITAPEGRVAAIGKLSGATSGAEIAGQSAGGGLIALMPAPLVPLADSVLSLASALVIRTVPGRREVADSAAADDDGEPQGQSLQAIAWRLFASGEMWAVIGVATIGGLVEPVFVLYVVRDLGIDVALVGVLLALGAVGGIVGGLGVGRLEGRLGTPLTLTLAAAVTAAGAVPMIFAGGQYGALLSIVVFELFTAFGGTVLVAVVFGALQANTQRRHISRTMSTAEVLMQVWGLAGLGVGILLALVVERRTSLIVYAVCAAAIGVCLLVRWARQPRRVLPMPVGHGHSTR